MSLGVWRPSSSQSHLIHLQTHVRAVSPSTHLPLMVVRWPAFAQTNVQSQTHKRRSGGVCPDSCLTFITASSPGSRRDWQSGRRAAKCTVCEPCKGSSSVDSQPIVLHYCGWGFRRCLKCSVSWKSWIIDECRSLHIWTFCRGRKWKWDLACEMCMFKA